MASLEISGLLWRIIGLLMLGSIIIFLTRSTLAVGAPAQLKNLYLAGAEMAFGDQPAHP